MLFTMLKDIGLGCYIGTNFMGGAVYAEDSALIAPSVLVLKKMFKYVIDFVVLTMSNLISLSISLFIIVTTGMNLMALSMTFKKKIRFCFSFG